ncbi:uncharacterized protein LOC133284912 [Gastrolobium bilobum]|uniref:uncharacterized protein LOC133284912 n=1 Tax=Gastrolobium bilobum TaxID=150636 RepID=UPI002AB21EE6|nr:uncharacterized protein LOC133284912 [Gastrolobium bilobum]
MEHASNRQLIPPSSPDISDAVGAPQLNSRLGHEYQVEVPSMMKESERLQLLMNPSYSELVHDNSHCFVKKNILEDSGHERGGYLGDNDGAINVSIPTEAADVKKNSKSDNGKGFRPTTFKSEMTVDQLRKSKNYLMAPGTLSNSWSDADVKSFLLGLFIFGKNFIQIKRFLENKGMGEILSFYYGKFYNSDEYRRWSDCKKIKGRKCITGHKLFTGRKQNELLSRLIPHVSEEFQDTLLQVSKSYVEGRTSLEEYICSLKSIVGLGVLVEAVGIGKGKEDLTSLAVKPGKKSRLFSIQTSKAWSSLGPSDIIKILTGGRRVSKAKSNDLFWEAVWPRLLARGWHSEQVKNQEYVTSKGFLVFLIPGVEKFSRRKLVKGDHYFDSVSDVLRKVVAEPSLLELEVEEAKLGSCNNEEAEKGFNEDGQSDYHHHCYLKPRASEGKLDSINQKLTKFIVVDTKVRQLRYPPVELEDTKMTGIARESARSSFVDDSPSEIEATMLVYSKKNISNADWQKGTHNRETTSQKELNSNPDNKANKMAENCENELKRTIKHQFSRRARSVHSNLAIPPIKRRRLSALQNSSGGLGSEKLGLSHSSCFADANMNVGDPVSHQQDVSLVSSSAEGSVEENNENEVIIANGVCVDKGISCDEVEKCESQPPINFNAPQVQVKSEDGEMMEMVEEDEQDLKPNDIIPRRQSTRNRPLTVRALESLANEFLHVPRRHKGKKAQRPQILKDIFSACGRTRTGVKTMLHSHSSDHGTPDCTEKKHLNEDCSVNENISKPLDYIEE